VFIHLAITRGQLMNQAHSTAQDAGAMAAIKGEADKIQKIIKGHPEIQISNINSPSQVVVAGSTKTI